MEMFTAMEGSLWFILFLTLVGFGLIILDVVLIPGGFVIAIGSGIILWSIWLNYKEFGLLPAAIHFIICLAITPQIIISGLKRFALKEEMDKEDGYVAVNDNSGYIGMHGTARSTLRPSGSIAVMVDGREKYLDCISEGSMIDEGEEIVIVEDRGTSLVVRRASDMPA